MNVPATITAGEVIENVIVKGDISKLAPEERARYYVEVCKSVGLNPLTRPFEYITLNGKLTLYAKRDAADQLRKLHGISIKVVEQKLTDDLLTVHVEATDKSGRKDEDFGAVPLPSTLKGEARANAILKAITKAKRRVTLSISGLGFLDETEVADIPPSARRIGANAIAAVTPSIDPNTGEIDEDFASAPGDAEKPAPAASSKEREAPQAGAGDELLMMMAREAAMRGKSVFDSYYAARTPAEKAKLRAAKLELVKLFPAGAE